MRTFGDSVIVCVKSNVEHHNYEEYEINIECLKSI